MKHTCSLVLVAVAMAACSAFAAVKTVTWTLPADWEANVSYGERNGRLAIDGSDFGYPSDPVGAPSLPFLPVSVAVPEGSVYSNCTVEATWEEVKVGGLEVWKFGGLRPSIINEPHVVGESPIETPEDPQYFGAARYPAKPESVGGIETLSGGVAILAWVTPYRWNGQSAKLEKATAIKITFAYDAPRAKAKFKAQASGGYTGVMYIVSPPDFTDLWQAYVDYRTNTHPHIMFRIVNTKTEIYDVADYNGVDDAQRIHKYLEARYAEAKTAGKKMYAILGAGCAKGTYDRAKEIPIRNNVAAGSMYYVSDLYYSCMDKKGGAEVWDHNGDGVFLGYKKAGGGYGCDTAAQVDWTPEIACFRFPVREGGNVIGIASKTKRTYTAREQIDGLVAKLRRTEGGNYGGDFKAGFSGKQTFSAWGRGNTSDLIAGECSFFDWRTNPWSASHTPSVDDWEYASRYDVKQYLANGRPLAQVYCGSSDEGTGAEIYGHDLDMDIHMSHGQKQTAAPFEAYNFFTTTKIQKLLNFSFSCQTGHLDTNDFDGNGNLCFAEACVLNPNGGALVTMNNTREGWGAAGGYHEILSLLIQVSMSEAFFSLSDGTAADAFIKGHERILSRTGGINPGTTMAGCYVEMNTMGDPLAKLCNINAAGTFGPTVGGWFLKDAAATNDVSFSGASGSLNLSVTPATAGESVEIGGSGSYKVFGKATVNGGHLVWNAPGGIARNGIEFKGAKGDILCEGTASRYFGTRFTNVGDVLVTGYNTTFDFDKTGKTRDLRSLKYLGTGAIGQRNYIRSREGGIFPKSFTIPVVNGTLVLQTTNIGGSGAAEDTDTPIFALTNAVLQISENPHWANEMLNRPVWMNGATIRVAYQSFGFGAKTAGAPGMDLWVQGEESNTISGTQDAEINGPFRVKVESNAVLKVSVPLTKSSYAGSLVKTGAGRLELRAANTFTGGITVRDGTVVFGDEALTSSACGEVTVESGATLRIEALPLASVTKLTVRDGGILILPGAETTASYQLVDPLVGSLNFEDGALVYNENDLDTPLQGDTTSDGYYMDTSSFLHWQDADGTWAAGAAGAKWLKGGLTETDYADGNSVMFPNYAGEARTVGVSGTVAPGYITFNNTATAYGFTNAAAKISVENLYTVGDTRFEPALSVGAKMAVTAGRTTVRDATVASATVSPEGTFQVEGTLSPATYIKSVTVNVTAFPGETWPYVGTRYKGYQFNGIRFCVDGKELAIPGGTAIAVSGTFNGKTATDSATVQGVAADGTIASYSGTQSVAQILDGSAATGWGGPDGGNEFVQSSGSCTVTITFGSPIRMFDSYKLAGGNTSLRSPKNWTVKVVPSGSDTPTQVDSRSCGTSANSWWTSPAIPYSGASSASLDVASGGTLCLNGTFALPVTVGTNATLAVTNASCLTAQKGFSLAGGVTLDVHEAGKFGWTKVLSGANLAAADIGKFALADEDAAAKIEGGNLFVATQGVRKGPYERTVAGAWNWDDADWTANGEPFGTNWAEVVTRASDDVFVTANGSTTGTLACAVRAATVWFTNETGAAQRVAVAGNGAVSCNWLDFSGLNGTIVWEPNLNGASVNAGGNTVILGNGNGGTLNVASNGYVSTAGTFAAYNNEDGSVVRFAGASARTLDTGKLPARGTVSFDDMTLTGGFQNALRTFLVEDGDRLTISGTAGNNARCTSSFDIRGGEVTVNPQGSWWYGENGVTKFDLTGGVLTANATGTTLGDSGSGVVFGYQGEGSFVLEVNIAGGRFLIPNSIANVWNATAFNLGTNGLFRAKGIGVRSGIGCHVNVNEASVFEIGSVGMAASCTACNLYGGTIAGYEAGAKVDGAVTLGGAGTLAAKAGAVLCVNGAVKADGATLNFGTAGAYEGAVRLAVLPEGVTNYTVSAGTWDLGSLRPTNAVLTKLAGAVAAELTDAELRQAAQGGLKLIRTSLTAAEVEGRVSVVTSSGTAVPATGGVSADGYLTLGVSYVEPLYATTDGATEWKSLAWTDAIGMPFSGDWSAMNQAVVSNTADGAELTIPEEFTKSLKIANTGTLTLFGETAVAAVDDSASTGETRVDCATANVTAGADTVVVRVGTGTLTLANGKRATMWNGADWPTARIAGFSGTAEIRYAGTTTATSLKYTADGAGVVSYAQKTDMAEEALQFNNTLTRQFEDGLDMRVKRISMGNPSGSPTQTFRQTGGRIEAVSAADMMANPTGNAPLLFAHWPGTVNYHLTGGELIATNGVTGSAYFGRDGIPCLYIGGGDAQAVMHVNRFINDERTPGKDKSGSVVELRPNGRLEVGGFGFTLTKNAELRMSGGTFLAYESAAMSSSKFTLTTGTVSTLAAADGATLTVNTVPTGTGNLVCGADGSGGKVVLKGGSWAAVALGGAFEIWLTAEQEAATQNVDLFMPGEGFDAAKATVRSSTGGEPDGTVCLYGGRVTFVPRSAFKLPIVGEVYTNNTPWHLANWHDSSAEPKAVDAAALPDFADVVLNVHSNAAILCDVAQTLSALAVRGEGAATFVKGAALAIASAKIETDMIATNDAVTITLADIAAGATLVPSAGSKLGNVTGGGTVSCRDFWPTYANLADPTAWTGTVRFVALDKSYTDLAISKMGNALSTAELAGTMTGGYFSKADATIGTLRVTGSFTLGNGYSDRTYTFGRLVGSGTLRHSNSGQQFKIHIGDAGEFTGTLSTAGAKIGIGENPTYAYATVNVASGAAFGVASRADAASSSTVTVAQGGWLNLVQRAPNEIVFKVTSGTLNLNGGVKVNGKTIAASQYEKNGGTITLKACTMTWNGGADGIWDTATSCWRDASGAAVAWHDGFAGGNTARFANVAAVTLGEPIAPALIDLAVPAAVLPSEGFVPTAPAVAFGNLDLADVAEIAGDMSGNYVSSKGAATPCFVTRTAGQIGVQFQKRDGGWLKCVKVVLTQDGADVKAQAVWAANASEADPGTKDFENAPHNATVVTTDGGNGYGIKNLAVTTAGHGELTVRAAQNFAAPVTVTNGLLRLAEGELAQDLTLAAGARLDLVAEPYAVTNVITSGALAGATLDNVTVNGAALSANEWTLEGGKLIRDTSGWIAVGEGAVVTMPGGLDGKKVDVFVDPAGGTLVADRVQRLDSMNVIGGALTLKATGEGLIVATNGIAAGAVTLDASGLDGTELAKRAAAGVPYSRWLVRGAPLPDFEAVLLPEMPKHYAVTNETVAGVGVRLVVTAPPTAMFGTFGVNVHNGTELDKTETPSGIQPLAHALWGNLKAEANKTTSVSNVTFAVGGNASGWGAGNAVDALQKQYMDDNGNCERTITLSGLAAVAPYRVIAYFSTDSGGIKFCPMRVNGVPYSADGAASVSDLSADWGDTGPQNGSHAIAEGVNALVTDVLAADEVVLGFERVNAGVARATPCAIQVVKVGEYVAAGKDFTATIDGDEHWEGIAFSEIAWDGGAEYEDGPNNTVTLTVAGDVRLATDRELELLSFAVKGAEDGGYLSFEDADGTTVGEATAKVSSFDFGGADSVFSPDDFGSRIAVMPRGYFTLTAPYAGAFQDGYSYQGEGNAFTGSGFAGAKVSVSADGTLSGDFDVTGGGMVNFGYGAVAASGNAFLGATKGTVEIGSWATVTVPHVRFLNSSDDANHAVLDLYGTLTVDSVSTQWNVWAEWNDYRGILLGHWSGTGEYNVGIDPYDDTRRGRLVGEAAYLELVYTAGAQTLNVTGGTVRVRGITANKAGGTVNLTAGGRLELAEGFDPDGAAIVQNYGAGTVAAYSYGGSTGWTDGQAVTFDGTTLDPNGLTIGFAGAITCVGELVVDDSSAGKNGTAVLGTGISGQAAEIRVNGGALELTGPTTLGRLTMAGGTRLVLRSVPQALAVGAADGISLEGVTVDVGLSPAAAEGVTLVSASEIRGVPVAGANLKAAGLALAVVADGNAQVLKTVPAKKGTVFFVR